MSLHRDLVAALERALPWLVLSILLFYTYLELFYAPYIGFGFSPSTGEIRQVYANRSDFDLQVGDELYAVGAHQVSEMRSNLRLALFGDAEPGDVLSLHILRDGQLEQVAWPVLGPNLAEILDRLLNAWLLGYVFWLAGVATLLSVRPKDTRYWLLAAFFMLTAVWLVVGNTNRWGYWNSGVFFRMALWLFIPVCIHLHWIMPKPLGKIPIPVLWGGYLAAALVAGLQWFERVPANAYAIPFALALLASAGCLVARFIRQPEERRRIWLLLFAFLFVAIPLVGLSIAAALSAIPYVALAALLTLPLIPGAYFYSVYRYQPGQLELRANRLIALYLFLLLLGTTLALTVVLVSLLLRFPERALFLTIPAGLAAALVTVVLFPAFQRFVESWLLGMPLPPASLLATHMARITTSLTRGDLVRLLREEILPTLLVRQSALFVIQNDRCVPVYTEGVGALPRLPDVTAALASVEVYRPARSGRHTAEPLAWVSLGLPLRFEGRLVGAWMFGRRDPDDDYSQAEVGVLQTLAGQTTIALVNIEQAEQLQALYQTNIDRHEEERTQLAHVLHDEILNKVAALYMSLDSACLSPRVEESYASAKDRIRQMVSELRPVTLDIGLYAALEELVEGLNERAGDELAIYLELSPADTRYPPQVEPHLFRIVQQACENALLHARARALSIRGELAAAQVSLVVEDDGVGFAAGAQLDLTHLLARKHFGLVGMVERAELIGAELRIHAASGRGTQVCVVWRADEQERQTPGNQDRL